MRVTLRALGVLCAALLAPAAPGLPGDLPAADAGGPVPPPPVACSPDKPTASRGEAIRVTALVVPPAGRTLRYAWTATAGRLDGEGREVRWSFRGLKPGPYTATVRVSDPSGDSAECAVQVIVQPPGTARALPRESGWSLLPGDRGEGDGYGLYSYLLLGSPPTEAVRERYLQALEAYVGLIPDITSLERYLPRAELNAAYLPIDAPLGPQVSAEWVLHRYDYARARALLRAIPGTHREGPYIVSALRPLSGATSLSGEYLYQDLSAVPPHLASSWVKAFLNQAAQERFWEGRTAERLALRLRTTIGILALGLPDVRKALDSWIAWTR